MTKSILVNGINKELNFTEKAVFDANYINGLIEKSNEPVFNDEAALVLTKDQAQYLCGGQHLVDTMPKLKDSMGNLVKNVEYICSVDENKVEENLVSEYHKYKELYLDGLYENLDILH